MSLHECVISWEAPATLKDVKLPTQGVEWIGEHVYGGTVGGAIRQFMALPAEQQRRIEMMIEPGVIAGLAATIVSSDALSKIANRSDVPKE